MDTRLSFVAPRGDGRFGITMSNDNGMVDISFSTKAQADKWRKYLQDMFAEGQLDFPEKVPGQK